MNEWTRSAQQELVTVRTGKEATSIDVKLSIDNSRPFERGYGIYSMTHAEAHGTKHDTLSE